MERDPGTMVGRQGSWSALGHQCPSWPGLTGQPQEAHEMWRSDGGAGDKVLSHHHWVGFSTLPVGSGTTHSHLALFLCSPPYTSGIEVGGAVEDMGSNTGAPAQRAWYCSRWAHVLTAAAPRCRPPQGLRAVS